MNEKAKKNKNDSQVGLSIQEVSQQLSIPENTIRKYLAYFNLEVDKVGRKILLSQETIACVSEILQLKSNGWSLSQIKTFRDSQPQAGSLPISNAETVIPETSIIEETEEPEAKVVDSPENSFESDNSIEAPIQEIAEEVPIENVFVQESPVENVNDFNNFANSEEQLPDREQSNEESHSDHFEAPRETSNRNLRMEEESEFDSDSLDEEPEQRHGNMMAPISKPPLTKDYVNKEIATQAKRASRLYRFLSSRNSSRDSAEVKADLDRRVEFLNGLRYIRDNWLDRQGQQPGAYQGRDLAGVN
jgi:hypothetical protein